MAQIQYQEPPVPITQTSSSLSILPRPLQGQPVPRQSHQQQQTSFSQLTAQTLALHTNYHAADASTLHDSLHRSQTIKVPPSPASEASDEIIVIPRRAVTTKRPHRYVHEQRPVMNLSRQIRHRDHDMMSLMTDDTTTTSSACFIDIIENSKLPGSKSKYLPPPPIALKAGGSGGAGTSLHDTVLNGGTLVARMTFDQHAEVEAMRTGGKNTPGHGRRVFEQIHDDTMTSQARMRRKLDQNIYSIDMAFEDTTRAPPPATALIHPDYAPEDHHHLQVTRKESQVESNIAGTASASATAAGAGTKPTKTFHTHAAPSAPTTLTATLGPPHKTLFQSLSEANKFEFDFENGLQQGYSIVEQLAAVEIAKSNMRHAAHGDVVVVPVQAKPGTASRVITSSTLDRQESVTTSTALTAAVGAGAGDLSRMTPAKTLLDVLESTNDVTVQKSGPVIKPKGGFHCALTERLLADGAAGRKDMTGGGPAKNHKIGACGPASIVVPLDTTTSDVPKGAADAGTVAALVPLGIGGVGSSGEPELKKKGEEESGLKVLPLPAVRRKETTHGHGLLGDGVVQDMHLPINIDDAYTPTTMGNVNSRPKIVAFTSLFVALLAGIVVISVIVIKMAR